MSYTHTAARPGTGTMFELFIVALLVGLTALLVTAIEDAGAESSGIVAVHDTGETVSVNIPDGDSTVIDVDASGGSDGVYVVVPSGGYVTVGESAFSAGEPDCPHSGDAGGFTT